MKYLTLIILIMLGGYVIYLKYETSNNFKEVGQAMGQQNSYLNLLVNEVYKKQIAACKSKSLGIDLKTLECMKEPQK